MKKEQVVDLHFLANLLANHYHEQEYGTEIGDDPDLHLEQPVREELGLDDYLEPGEALSSLHGTPKKDHLRAVLRVMEALTEDMDVEYEETLDRERGHESYFDRYPSAVEVLRELYDEGPADSLTGLSDRIDAAYSSMSSRVDYMVEKGWLEDREHGNSRAVFLPGQDPV